jgi:hypothetical protein
LPEFAGIYAFSFALGRMDLVSQALMREPVLGGFALQRPTWSKQQMNPVHLGSAAKTCAAFVTQ